MNQDHLKDLTTLASVVAIRIQDARLAEAQVAEQQRERELSVAREIMSRFRPEMPVLPGYELEYLNRLAYEVGGDYFDSFQREDGKLVLTVGDVSGKGTAAALLMSSLHAAVHAQANTHESLVKTIGAVNRYLVESIPPNRFVTLFYAVLDPKDGSLSFLNAGHNPPLVVHSNGVMEQLASGGLPLGIILDTEFREGRTTLSPDDVLMIYSDGVSEAINPRGEEFGPTRLYEVVASNLNSSAAEIRNHVEAALTKFCQGSPFVDDITLLICKRRSI